MENAFDALKMAFAVIVFVLAVAIAFALLGQANATAREVFYSLDTTTYLDHARVGGEAEHRIVGMETIIPTIYRYSIENCGVTIISKDGKLVARYDTETENVASNIKNYLAYDPVSKQNSAPIVENAYKNYLLHINYLVEIFSKLDDVNAIKTMLNDSETIKSKVDGTTEYRYSDNIDTRIQELYSYRINGIKNYGAPWGSNYVAERIKADLTGDQYNIDNKIYRFASAIVSGGGFTSLNSYLRSRSFKEYIIEEGTEYNVPNYDDRFTGGVTQSSTTQKTSKVEIIYVQQ